VAAAGDVRQLAVPADRQQEAVDEPGVDVAGEVVVQAVEAVGREADLGGVDLDLQFTQDRSRCHSGGPAARGHDRIRGDIKGSG